jgi:hypothetical protein
LVVRDPRHDKAHSNRRRAALVTSPTSISMTWAWAWAWAWAWGGEVGLVSWTGCEVNAIQCNNSPANPKQSTKSQVASPHPEPVISAFGKRPRPSPASSFRARSV